MRKLWLFSSLFTLLHLFLVSAQPAQPSPIRLGVEYWGSQSRSGMRTENIVNKLKNYLPRENTRWHTVHILRDIHENYSSKMNIRLGVEYRRGNWDRTKSEHRNTRRVLQDQRVKKYRRRFKTVNQRKIRVSINFAGDLKPYLTSARCKCH